jgi:hypothetical protein
MVSQHPDPYGGMTDEQVLARAAKALKKVQELPIGGAARSMQWAVYEDAKAELDLRLCRHVLRKIRERKNGELRRSSS